MKNEQFCIMSHSEDCGYTTYALLAVVSVGLSNAWLAMIEYELSVSCESIAG